MGRFARANKANIGVHHFMVTGGHKQAEAEVAAKMIERDVRGKKSYPSQVIECQPAKGSHGDDIPLGTKHRWAPEAAVDKTTLSNRFR